MVSGESRSVVNSLGIAQAELDEFQARAREVIEDESTPKP